MKRVVCIITVMFLAVMFVGCASTSSSRLGADSVSGLKGKTEGEIISQFGKPFKKYTTSEGVKILEYRQSAQDGGAMNSMAAISSFGAMSGSNSAYVDIMKIYLTNGSVTKATFEENVQGITMPGM
jgi:hypothetical protein